MPRTAWLALGVAAGALLLDVTSGLVVALTGTAILCAAVGVRFASPSGAAQDAFRRFGPLALGLLVIGTRGAAGGTAGAAVSIPPGAGPWVGLVDTVGAPRDGNRPATIRLEGNAPLLVAATLPWYPPVVPGDRVQVHGSIRPPPPDDYGAYLARIGAVGTLRADALELLPAEGTLARTLEGFRRAASDGLDRALPEPESGLAAGILIGLRDRVDRDLAAAFTIAGASHVVAISGWNIAIVASTLAALAGGVRRRRRALLMALGIVLYVAFVGPSPSVVRAAGMAGVALLARELGRPGSAAAALGWACTVLLVVDPTWVDDAGFRLSVLATAGIIAWGTQLTARLAGAEPRRARRWVADILGVSFAAQAATMPVVLLEFGRLSLVAPLVNLIVVPLVPPAMATGALALVIGVVSGLGVPGVAATLVGLPAWALYAAMVTVVRTGSSLPLASLTLAPPWDSVAAAASLVFVLAIARRGDRVLAWLRARRPQRSGESAGGPRRASAIRAAKRGHGSEIRRSRLPRIAAMTLAGATIGLALVIAHRPDGATRIVVMDVGQGDGILVEGARGSRLVIDGGPDPNRMLTALDERLPPWDRRIDVLVLTHPHEDHVAGLATLLHRYRVGRVYEPGMIGPGPGYKAWAAVFANGGPPHGRLSTGDRMTLDTISFQVLWPDANRVPLHPADGGSAINNVSIVLLGSVNGHRFLLSGDVEQGVDPELLARGLPQLDLLKVAHHGSGTASTVPFLEKVRPKIAVVSAGLGNPYGHPAPSTIEHLRDYAGRTYRTDLDGTVEVTFDGAAMRVRASGPRPNAKPTRAPATTTGAVIAVAMIAVAAPAFLCGVAPSTKDGLASVQRPPVGPVSPLPASVILGAPALATALRAEPPRLPRLPMPRTGAAGALGYHRSDADLPGIGDRAAPRNRSPRLLLGRRRVRPRRGAGVLPRRSDPLSRRRAGALAPRDGSRRSHPPPR
ncbi:MAG TPA: ComEC/Rec2 family competence protein [Candidatus Dormibacteraeota bacterium]|nr:ComEC/Rec2 family competence protein [Candidatus Dormibacteraeota bacterium]